MERLEFTAEVIGVVTVINHVINVSQRTGLASAGGKSRGVTRR
jgi:hypothetical protein